MVTGPKLSPRPSLRPSTREAWVVASRTAFQRMESSARQSIRSVVSSAVGDGCNIRFFINARTDIFFQQPPKQHDEAMVVEAIVRARAYADAGADGLFVLGLV